MHIWRQSKIPAFVAACAILAAGSLLRPSRLRAGQVAVITDQNGRSVYVNGNPAPAPAGDVQASPVFSNTRLDTIIDRVSSRYQVDPKLVHAVIRVESNYDPAAVSSKGAMGLMQLIPSTARRFGVRNPFDPKENIQGGVSYLKYLLHLFGGNLPLSLAAYNSGEARVIRSGGVPAIPETERYVRKVTHLYHSGNSSAMAEAADGGIEPIVRYVDSAGVVHFTNAE